MSYAFNNETHTQTQDLYVSSYRAVLKGSVTTKHCEDNKVKYKVLNFVNLNYRKNNNVHVHMSTLCRVVPSTVNTGYMNSNAITPTAVIRCDKVQQGKHYNKSNEKGKKRNPISLNPHKRLCCIPMGLGFIPGPPIIGGCIPYPPIAIGRAP